MAQQYLRVLLAAMGLLVLAACSSGGNSEPDPADSLTGNPTTGDAGTGSGDGSGSDSGTLPVSFGDPTNNQIRPGVGVVASGSFCTSNFIYADSSGNFYIGAAAHCFSPDANSGIDSCDTNNLPLGTPVQIENAQHNGSLVYSSWQAMQANNEQPGSAPCVHNDFALVKIDPRDHANVHPAVIAFEGPTGLLRGGANVGEDAYSYGQSPAHFGVPALEEKVGSIQDITGGGWGYSVSFDNPALSGDSGSAVLHETGQALGVLTVVSVGVGLGVTPVSNGVMNLEWGLDYANDYMSGSTIRLVSWSRFTP